ncbi:hypothetical protein BDZ91DRAFT_511257 [Kalaharituber pfeilii]|nr:hypothetical protein BDZ91DRAFT_511257 [Kalaharituber pfeilii]
MRFSFFASLASVCALVSTALAVPSAGLPPCKIPKACSADSLLCGILCPPQPPKCDPQPPSKFYFEPKCQNSGSCRNLMWKDNEGYLQRELSGYIVSGGCCEFFQSNDCSGKAVTTTCNAGVGWSQLADQGWNDEFGSARCTYSA